MTLEWSHIYTSDAPIPPSLTITTLLQKVLCSNVPAHSSYFILTLLINMFTSALIISFIESNVCQNHVQCVQSLDTVMSDTRSILTLWAFLFLKRFVPVQTGLCFHKVDDSVQITSRKH